MKQRCLNPRSTKYHAYGAKGIAVCERWRSFENFLADMGECPEGHTLDRFPDRTGNYEPGNCRWATAKEQQANRDCNHYITHQGETRSITEWAEATGLPRSVLYYRLGRGRWPIEKALATPSQEKYRPTRK